MCGKSQRFHHYRDRDMDDTKFTFNCEKIKFRLNFLPPRLLIEININEIPIIVKSRDNAGRKRI